MSSYNKKISLQSKVSYNPVSRELEDKENSGLEDRVESLETTVGDSTSGLVKDVSDLETTVGDSTSGLVKDVSDLETTVGDSNSGLVKDVSDLKTTVGDSNSGLVKDVNDLKNATPSATYFNSDNARYGYLNIELEYNNGLNLENGYMLKYYPNFGSGLPEPSTSWIQSADVESITPTYINNLGCILDIELETRSDWEEGFPDYQKDLDYNIQGSATIEAVSSDEQTSYKIPTSIATYISEEDWQIPDNEDFHFSKHVQVLLPGTLFDSDTKIGNNFSRIYISFEGIYYVTEAIQP